MNIFRIGLLSIGILACLRSFAQQAGSLDTNFVAVAGTDAVPNRLAPLPDGRVYVGGGFTNYGGTGRASFVRLLRNGEVDTAFTLQPLRKVTPAVILNNQVLVPASTNLGSIAAAIALPDGRAVIGGVFSHLGATPVNNLLLLGMDGSAAVSSFDIEGLEVSSLLPGPAGTFYVGCKGSLASARLPLLRFHVTGARDTSFTPPTLAELGYQSANPFILAQGPGDTVYAVPAAAVGFNPVSDILRLTASGSLDTAFAVTGKASIPFANLSSFVSDPLGRLAFANVASYRGSALPRKINRLNLDGSLDSGFLPTVDPGQGGRVVAAQADGKVLFTSAAAPVSRLNADGTPDTGYANPALVPIRQTLLSLTQFAPASDGSLFAAGLSFTPTFQVRNGAYRILGDPNTPPTVSGPPLSQTNTVGARTRFGVTAQGAAPLAYQWYRNGQVLPGAIGPNLVVDPSPAEDDGALFHCVVSNGLGSTPSDPARLTLLPATAGSVYRETDTPVGADSSVVDLEWDASGRLLAVGGFTKFHGTNRVRAARLVDEGRLVDPSFEPSGINSVGLLQSVYPLASGRVLAVGSVSLTYSNVVHQGVLRLGANGALDTSFNPAGTGGDNGTVFSELADGSLFVGASFWNGIPLPNGYGRLAADGVRDPAFVPSPAFGPTRVVLALPDGSALVGGLTNLSIPSLNGSGVIRLRPDGSRDPAFYTGLFHGWSRPQVTSILRQPDGRILVAGAFTRDNVLPGRTIGVIRLLEDGRMDPSFNPVTSLTTIDSGSVSGIALQADGRILIRGNFGNVGGFARPGVARLWPNGVVDPDFAPGRPTRGAVAGSVSALAVSPSNNVFLGGDFLQFDGLPRTNFVRIHGGPLQPVPAAPGIGSQPTRVVAKAGTAVTLTVVPSGDGPFQYQWRRNETRGSTNFVEIPGATNASHVMPAVRYGPGPDSGLFQVTVINPGGFAVSSDITLLVEPDPVVPGAVDNAFAPAAASGILTGQAQLVAPAPDGRLYASLRTTLVRLLEDGTPDPTFQAPADLTAVQDGGISAVKWQPDGKILIAGRMKDGALARLLPDGSYDPGFVRTNRYNGGFQNVPWEIGLQRDGRILLAGSFENFAGRPVNGLLRFLPDGTVDPSFPFTALEAVLPNPTRTLPGTAVSLRVLSDDRIYVGGGFNRVGGVTRVGVARLNPDGSLDTSFEPPANAATPLGQGGNMLFYTLGPVTPQGGVYVFGTFQPVPGGRTDSALRLAPNGSVDDTFHVSTDFQINYGAVQGDGKLIVTGQFTRLNGENRAGFARLNLDGTTDGTFTPATGFGVGSAMVILPDGKLMVGGTRYFTGIGPSLPAQEIDFTLRPGGLELSWPVAYRLQRATRLSPADWQDVAEPSPFVVPLSGPGEFFRVVPR